MNKTPLLAAALLAPLAAPLTLALVFWSNPVRIVPLEESVLAVAYPAVWLCGVPLYLLLRRLRAVNWWTAGLMGLCGWALLPLWVGLAFLLHDGGPWTLPRLADIAALYQAMLEMPIVLAVIPAIVTGFAVHGVALATEWLIAARQARAAAAQ